MRAMIGSRIWETLHLFLVSALQIQLVRVVRLRGGQKLVGARPVFLFDFSANVVERQPQLGRPMKHFKFGIPTR
jgi:hypothetical protein